MASKIKYDRAQVNALATSVNPYGKRIFVDGVSGNNAGGLTPQTAFLTIQLGLAAMEAGDEMIIAPGTYTLVATFTPLANQVFRAAVVRGNAPTVTITSTSALTGDMVSVDVSGCEFTGIQFLAGHANLATLVDIADAADVSGLKFDQCVFNGADKTSVIGLNASDATFILTSMVVTDCLFRDLTGTMINIGVLGFAYSVVKNNRFAHDINSGIGIALADTTAFVTGKGYIINDNVFLPFDATGDEVGISIAGTENTTGAGMIARNFFAYGAAATSITQDKLSLSEIDNRTGDAATGGTVVDPGT